jgi:hypothetical protein
VIIVHTGGGTVDLSAYRMNASQDGFEEIATPDCKLQPSVTSPRPCMNIIFRPPSRIHLRHSEGEGIFERLSNKPTFFYLPLTMYNSAKLEGSVYGIDEQINDMSDIFDKTTKRLFRNPEEPCFIKFGARRDKDLRFGIVNGQLKLSGWV